MTDRLPLPNQLLAALIAIHQTPPSLISAPFHGVAPRKPPTPAATPLVGSARSHFANTRRASVAIIIRIRPQQSPPSSSSGDPPSPTPSSPPFATSTASAPQDSPSSPGPIQLPSILTNVAQSVHPPALTTDIPNSLRQFFAQPWVSSGTPEIFFIKRACRTTDRWSSHLAFPGGRMEPEDEDGLFCALRETWEEVGIDLAERKHFLFIGQLDDREITTSLGKRLLMVLSPYVFLSTRPANEGPEADLESKEVESAYWVPIAELFGPESRWGEVVVDLSSRLAPAKSWIIRKLLNLLVGSMKFQSILVRNHPCAIASGTNASSISSGSLQRDLELWGLTLGMTLDLITFLTDPSLPTTTTDKPRRSIRSSPSLTQTALSHQPPVDSRTSTIIRSPSLPSLPSLLLPPPPNLSSIFPRFSHPDINALIYLLGSKYRYLLKIIHEGRSSRRYSSSRLALNAFYTAVRKALIVAIVLRSVVGVGVGVGILIRVRKWMLIKFA